jgi:hypothetical protein
LGFIELMLFGFAEPLLFGFIEFDFIEFDFIEEFVDVDFIEECVAGIGDPETGAPAGVGPGPV